MTYTTFTGPYVGKPNAFQVVVAGEYTRHKDFHSVQIMKFPLSLQETGGQDASPEVCYYFSF